MGKGKICILIVIRMPFSSILWNHFFVILISLDPYVNSFGESQFCCPAVSPTEEAVPYCYNGRLLLIMDTDAIKAFALSNVYQT